MTKGVETPALFVTAALLVPMVGFALQAPSAVQEEAPALEAAMFAALTVADAANGERTANERLNSFRRGLREPWRRGLGTPTLCRGGPSRGCPRLPHGEPPSGTGGRRESGGSRTSESRRPSMPRSRASALKPRWSARWPPVTNTSASSPPRRGRGYRLARSVRAVEARIPTGSARTPPADSGEPGRSGRGWVGRAFDPGSGVRPSVARERGGRSDPARVGPGGVSDNSPGGRGGSGR